ncbi:hypothetical protein L1987_47495 [Smallanthus sonchifolius]|uniref:Uncharacterized protein n=1 Tax=Smallanthus sonchifolius TaxID=185202 RepID=A0ACB9G2R0_9ASTR|nr:hypothetical protein L1987_47495 [Smallanthus sonchifolius]
MLVGGKEKHKGISLSRSSIIVNFRCQKVIIIGPQQTEKNQHITAIVREKYSSSCSFISSLPPNLERSELRFRSENHITVATRYWIVSLPVQSSATSLWSRLRESISKNSFDTPLYRFNIPNLRVGTLDSLLALSDDLLKSNAFIEGCSHKIRRQIEDLEKASGILASSLTVDGVRFVWDEAKYPTMSPLKEIVDGIHVQVAKIDDDLKVRIPEYNNVRSQLNAINRKQSGRLCNSSWFVSHALLKLGFPALFHSPIAP